MGTLQSEGPSNIFKVEVQWMNSTKPDKKRIHVGSDQTTHYEYILYGYILYHLPETDRSFHTPAYDILTNVGFSTLC